MEVGCTKYGLLYITRMVKRNDVTTVSASKNLFKFLILDPFFKKKYTLFWLITPKAESSTVEEKSYISGPVYGGTVT